jgi:hypothetical protein
MDRPRQPVRVLRTVMATGAVLAWVLLGPATVLSAATAAKPRTACAFCDSVAGLLDSLPRVRPSKATQAKDQHPCLAEAHNVCSVAYDGTYKDFPAATTPHDLLARRLEHAGWRQILECAADGPDGTSMAYARDSMVVVIEGQWDGGDDSDSTYVPQDFYKLRIVCGVQAKAAREH